MPPRSLSHLLGKKSPADCAAGRKCAGSTYQSSQCIIILKTLTTAKTFFNLILYHHTLLFFIYLPTYHLNRPARSSRHWSTSSHSTSLVWLSVPCSAERQHSPAKVSASITPLPLGIVAYLPTAIHMRLICRWTVCCPFNPMRECGESNPCSQSNTVHATCQNV